MENFEGVLNTTKWAKIGKCSQDTALRDMQDIGIANGHTVRIKNTPSSKAIDGGFAKNCVQHLLLFIALVITNNTCFSQRSIPEIKTNNSRIDSFIKS